MYNIIQLNDKNLSELQMDLPLWGEGFLPVGDHAEGKRRGTHRLYLCRIKR